MHRRELVYVGLGGELAGNVEGDGVGAVRVDDRGEFFGDMVERRVPADAATRRRTLGAQLGIKRAARRLRRQMQRRPLGAKLAAVGRMRRIAAHAGDLPGVGLDQHPAAGAAQQTDETTDMLAPRRVCQQGLCQVGTAS